MNETRFYAISKANADKRCFHPHIIGNIQQKLYVIYLLKNKLTTFVIYKNKYGRILIKISNILSLIFFLLVIYVTYQLYMFHKIIL